MNTYSRALRHIDMADVKKKHQQKISEQKIQKRLEREERKYIQSVMEEKKCDWRKELNEQMTTSDVFFTTLPATGDVNLAYPSWDIQAGEGYTISDGTITITGSDGGLFGNGVAASFDTSIYTTLVFDVNIIGDEILGVFGSSPSPILVALTSGTYSVSLENILLFVVPLNGSVQINNLRYQRRTPMNVFVSLDSPEATSFIRTGSPNTTPEERRKQLQSQLKAGKQYTDKQFGPNFPGSNYVMPGDAGVTPGVMTYTFDRVTDSGTQKITKSVPYNPKQTSTTKSQPTSSGNTADRIYDLQRKIAVLDSQRKGLQQSRDTSYYDDTISHFQKELDLLTKSSTTSPQSQKKTLTPQQNAALDKQIKDLQAQAEKNKQDAQNKQWAAAAQLGMDALTAATLLSPIPGDEAIVAAAQGAKLGPTAARGFAKANPGKYNPFLNQQTNKYLNLPRK